MPQIIKASQETGMHCVCQQIKYLYGYRRTEVSHQRHWTADTKTASEVAKEVTVKARRVRGATIINIIIDIR